MNMTKKKKYQLTSLQAMCAEGNNDNNSNNDNMYNNFAIIFFSFYRSQLLKTHVHQNDYVILYSITTTFCQPSSTSKLFDSISRGKPSHYERICMCNWKVYIVQRGRRALILAVRRVWERRNGISPFRINYVRFRNLLRTKSSSQRIFV